MPLNTADREPSKRDRHLFGPGHKRILSLDGGGVRGAITLAFLERLEAVIDEIEGRPTRLADWFDIIGGTSTGAIIASALALGYRASDIYTFYKQLGPRVFQSSFWRIAGLRAKFNAENLKAELANIVGDRKLDSDDLETGLCIVTKRLDTGSVWMLMNNPRLPHWETPADDAFIGNRHYGLASVIRASAAAPYYFDPEYIEIVKGMAPGLFVDGAVSPHNNPVLHILLAATLPQYGLSWPFGADKLTIVSVGTGSYRYRVRPEDLTRLRTLGVTAHALASQMSDAGQLVLLLMSWFGQSPTPWTIDSIISDLGSSEAPTGNPLFHFLRYDVVLEQEWLARELGLTLDARTIERYRMMDAAENIQAIHEIGAVAAASQIKREHLLARTPPNSPANAGS